MSTTVAASVMGALLGAAFAPSGPSPEELRLAHERAEAERKAAEARAKAEQEKHDKLMGALVSVPGRPKPADTPGAARGLKLTALAPVTRVEPSATAVTTTEMPVAAAIGDAPLNGSDEEARAWMDNPETLFKAVWKPLPLGKPLPQQLVAQPTCKAGATQGCEITVKDAAPPLRLGHAAPPPAHARSALPAAEVWQRKVALLRSPNCAKSLAHCDDLALYLRGLAWPDVVPPSYAGARQFTTLDQLRKTGEVLIETMLIKVIGETSLPGKVAVLYYNIYDTTRTTFDDALKVAGYLGSSDLTAPPPELTPLEETAGALAPMPLDEVPGQFDPAGFALDTAPLARKLREIWAKQ
ncbi:MAG: hypothetical protein Q7U85_10340 [Rhodocyclaceae bacterium]|nr:hypothetical protein [Rhodocyclaceae bacterium]